MNHFDIAAMLMTYSIKCINVKNKEELIEILNELNNRINNDEFKKIKLEVNKKKINC